MTRLSTCLTGGAVLGLAAGAALIFGGLWIPAKAVVAQILLERAWHDARQTGAHIRPWHWADMAVVGRLTLPDARYVVLDEGTGQSMAFAPTLVRHGVKPDGRKLRIIAAHRDTHFKDLHRLATGTIVTYEPADGPAATYKVVKATVTPPTFTLASAPDADLLLLVTCWPPNAPTSNANERLVVWAERIDAPIPASAQIPASSHAVPASLASTP